MPLVDDSESQSDFPDFKSKKLSCSVGSILSGNNQHNFAEAAVAPPQLKGLSDSSQRCNGADCGSHCARINQGSDFAELRPVALDDKEDPTGIMFPGIGF
jgi:hypothetical protein